MKHSTLLWHIVWLLSMAYSVSCRSPAPSQPGAGEAQKPIEAYFPDAALSDDALCERLIERTRTGALVLDDPTPERRTKVIVSDLHLGPGPDGAEFQGLEDFFFHAEWQKFLDQQARHGPTDLIIAGDFIDFWQILGALDLIPDRDSDLHPDPDTLLAADQASALRALDYALIAHEAVFVSLGQFLSTGDHRVILVPGNHDAELLWPRVRLAIARAMRVTDTSRLDRLKFVDGVGYRHAGVHVEHGHRFDSANRFAIDHAPFARDTRGQCRLLSSWGEVFVAKFFNDIERQYPFVDNLYPESAAALWGMRDEPDKLSEAVAVARFVDVLLSSQSGAFNLSALTGTLRGLLGLPSHQGDALGEEMFAHMLDQFPSGDRVLVALHLLADDPAFAGVGQSLTRAVKALPDVGEALGHLTRIDPTALERLRAHVLGEPMITAARRILKQPGDVTIAVFGHTHLPNGQVKRVTWRGGHGYYANTGAWIPVQRVDDVRAKDVAWTELSTRDRSVFPAIFPAVVIEYDGATAEDGPTIPRIVFSN